MRVLIFGRRFFDIARMGDGALKPAALVNARYQCPIKMIVYKKQL
jgi:hypothetical protein